MRRIVLLSSLVALVRAASPPLSISLETSWPAPPLLLEIVETVYDEQPSSYFPLLNLLGSRIPRDNSTSPQSILMTSLDLIASHDLLPKASSFSTLHLALGLHTSAPKIEASYSYYESTVDEAKLGVQGCESWVEWRGKGFCGVDELRRDIELSIEEGVHLTDLRPTPLPFDHISLSSSPSESPQAVLYYNPESHISAPLLTYLDHHASQIPSFQYIVRYRPPLSIDEGVRGERGERRTGLSGYGVEMVLKRTDYLVVDDRASAGAKQTSQKPDSSGVNRPGMFSDVLGQDPWLETAIPIASHELREIGLQAATLIMASDDPLSALEHLSQDFPKYSAALARKVNVPPKIRIKASQSLHRGQVAPAVYINGKAYRDPELNAYSLLKAIRTERDLILSLTSLGLTPKQAFELISDPLIGQAQAEEDPAEGLVDASDRLEGGEVIIWWNDIEKDKRSASVLLITVVRADEESRYKSWPIHTQGYLRPLYPGQFHTIRRNAWNLVFVLDLALVPSLDTIVNSMSTMIQRGVPIRFGIVPMYSSEDDEISYKMARIFHYVVKTFGRGATRDFLAEIIAATPSTPASPGIVKLQTVRQAYEQLAASSSKDSVPLDEILSSDDDSSRLEQTVKYTERLMATRDESAPGHLFINGKYAPMGGQWTMMVQSELGAQLNMLQEQIVAGLASEDISTFYYDLPSTSSRRTKLIVPGNGENKLRIFNLLELFEDDPTKRLTTDFVYSDNAERAAPITMWVVGDLDSPEGQVTVKNALKHLQTPECASRLGFVHIPGTVPDMQHGYRLSTLIYQLVSRSALSMTSPADLFKLIQELGSNDDNLDTDGTIKPSTAQQVPAGSPLHFFTSAGWSVTDTSAAADFWTIGTKIGASLGLNGKQPHLLVNGRLVGPLTPATFPVGDFDALEVFEHRKRVKPVIDLLKTMYDDITSFDRATLATLISMTSSIIASAYKPSEDEGIFNPGQASRGRFYEKLDVDGDMSFSIREAETAILHVAAVIDPVSEQAQRWTPLLRTLSGMENVAVSVYLEPDVSVNEMRLKRFYRFALAPELSFDVDGYEVSPGVDFADLPSTPIFTLGMDTPPSWVVSPSTSPYDLDNLVLGLIHNSAEVLFVLKQLLIEGHAREANNVPPRGLQLQLSRNGLEVASDTQVMANLGYFQFKATPGLYHLAIRPGRGTEVYDLESVGNEGWASPSVNETGTAVVLSSFEGKTILPRFDRRLGMEAANVLLEDAVATSPSSLASTFLSTLKSIVGLTNTETSLTTRHADINIFTVASGLLYERFSSIMILSVMKHTNSSVKFWFIENFLSPSFLAFIPHLAEEYGFQYELVTYKWPHWLRAQTEKQRIIWAYKILFLDVLFPMDLDKVIFVDADQIVRVDMKELVEVDLHGRVYGYPPMGNDRTEMEGFRFWKTGYWKDALHGRPYHISALYVIDLKRFRQLATGDRLRGQYHALSADPNSLANLDQDLPNSMQDQIPIFTLDQDWLWCQTWCSDESLATAKTIDLCQNPLTKEPKLVRARQIPEWDVYDQEIAAFAARISDEGGALAASVDDLAAEKVADGPVDQMAERVLGDEGDASEGEEAGAKRDGQGRMEDEL